MLSRGIFISYDWVDRDIAEQLTHRLQRIYGHSYVWMDEYAHTSSDRWVTIRRQIARCEAFLLLVSPDSLDSTYCQMELQAARYWEKRVIPVQLYPDVTIPADMQTRLMVNLTGGLTVESLTQLQWAINFDANIKPDINQTHVARPADPTRPSATPTTSTRPNRNLALTAPPASPYQVIATPTRAQPPKQLLSSLEKTRKHVRQAKFRFWYVLTPIIVAVAAASTLFWLYYTVAKRFMF